MFSPEKSVLLVIDVQGKLASLVHEHEKTTSAVKGMIKAAKILGIPILWTEQAPNKIGATIPLIADELKDAQPIKKMSFSCCGNSEFLKALRVTKRKEIIIVGIETHVCVYQTVADLLTLKFKVEVVADAVSSRSLANKQWALKKIKSLGAGLTTVEMMICELLQTAEHPKFREIMALIK